MHNATSQPILEVRDLKKYYKTSSGLLPWFGENQYIRAVDDVDIDVFPEEVVGIVGESGSGKSTLGETILRLEEPTEGMIRIRGDDIVKFGKKELKQLRQDCQIIFQDPYETLNPQQTVLSIVAEPLHNFYDLDRESIRTRVCEMLNDVGLRPAEEYLEAYPDQLSGGQRQRINIARALILDPNLLIADEPVSMLDVSIQSSILNVLNDLQEKLGFAMLFISHDLSVVRLISDRTMVMYKGEIVEKGETDHIMTDPKHPYTQALLRSLPDPTRDREHVLLPEPDHGDAPASGCNFRSRCPDAMEECSEIDPSLRRVEEREVSCLLYQADEK